jgi:WD40 repeat protein
MTEESLFEVACPDENWLAVGTYVGTIHLYDMSSGKVSGMLEGHIRPISSIAIDPTGKLLASADKEGVVLVWDIAKKTPLYELSVK